ncbi:MAG: hypothetical protein R3A47_04905 [Polyangiales bacterium]
MSTLIHARTCTPHRVQNVGFGQIFACIGIDFGTALPVEIRLHRSIRDALLPKSEVPM